MADHDPLCLSLKLPDRLNSTLWVNSVCRCDEYARVRADERERIFSGVRWRRSVGDKSWSIECLTDRDAECPGCLCDCHVEAEVRERIAQEPCSHDLSMHDAKIRADERERLRAQAEEMYVAAIRYYEASGHSHGMGQMDAFKRVLRLLGGESE